MARQGIEVDEPVDADDGSGRRGGLEVWVLGPVEVRWNRKAVGIGSAKPRAVLARLVIDRRRVVSADRLLEDVWPESPSGGAEIALRSTISRIRKRLRDAGIKRELIVTRPSGYLLEVGNDEVDAARFERLVSEGQAALIDGQVNRGVILLGEAVALWRGEAFGEFSADPFARTEARRLAELRLGAIEGRVEANLMLGHHAQLVGELDALTAEHPFRERLWAQRMLALYRSGRQADALRVYRDLRDRLVDELGLEPGPDVVRLEQDILGQRTQLDWSPAAVLPPDVPARPGPASVLTVPFVGREAELRRIESWWQRARAGPSELLLVTGESGIGKSRLVEHLADAAAAGGAVALWGRCDEEPIGPYQPFAEMLGRHLRGQPVEAVEAMPAWWTRELARLVPELGEPSLEASDPQTERFRFFEAVTATLLHAAGMQPTLLILDDLHWADRATLLLLRHVLRNGAPVGPAVVAIYTDTTLVQRSGLRQLLADLRRDGAPEHLVLQGLDEESVRVLLGGRGAGAAQLASTFHGLTDGNPLLLGELVRQSANSADQPLGSALFAEMAVPEAVKELVARRVSRLADNVNRFLQMAAVAGPEFDAGLVSSCAGMTADEELDILDSCVAAGVLVEVDGAPDRYAFTHGLYREAIYSELLRSRRFRMHDRLGDEIEQRQRDRLDHHLNELAYHFSRGALQANAQKAISYLIAAGDRARRALAFEEAVDQYRRAVDVVGRVGGGGAARGDALLALAEAQDEAGDGVGADRSFEEAASLARALGDTERLARAVRRGRPGL